MSLLEQTAALPDAHYGVFSATGVPVLTPGQELSTYRLMLLIRRFEEKAAFSFGSACGEASRPVMGAWKPYMEKRAAPCGLRRDWLSGFGGLNG